MVGIVKNPYEFFVDIDGTALEAGKIYIGEANLDPKTNPVAVFSDAELTIPLAQPVRTIAGIPDDNGTPIDIYVDVAAYSITVDDQNDVLVYSDLQVLASDTSVVLKQAYVSDGVTATYTLDEDPIAKTQTTVTINGVSQHQDSYTLSGSDITLNDIPPAGDAIEITTMSFLDIGTTTAAVVSFVDTADLYTATEVEAALEEVMQAVLALEVRVAALEP